MKNDIQCHRLLPLALSILFLLSSAFAAPPAPVIRGITPDTGEPDDGVTSVLSITLSGTAQPNTRVTVKSPYPDYTYTYGSTTADASGFWMVPVTGSFDALGSYMFVAIATDSEGADSPASARYEVFFISGPAIASYPMFGTVGQAMDSPIDVKGMMIRSISVTGLPPGLAYEGGKIRGTPTTAGLYRTTITATSGSGTDRRTYSFFINTEPFTPLAAPSNLAATAISSSRVTLTWTDNSTGETDFVIESSTDGATFARATTAPGGTQTYTLAGLNSGTTYYFRVRAINMRGASPLSNTASVTTPASDAPTQPGTLTATATASNTIELQWQNAGVGQMHWEVERSTDNANFTVIHGAIVPSSTRATDSAVSPATTYYYRVRGASNSSNTYSAYSNVASARTPATPPPSGTWQSSDVGSVASTGSDSASGGTVTVTGGGDDIWGNADSFRFRYQMLTGNGSITARVMSISHSDGWAKAGVMIRNSLTAGARNVFLAVTPSWHGITAQARSADGGSTTSIAGPASSAPYWLRLTRAGTTFTAQASPDGSAWTTCGTFTVTMDADVAIGLAVTSHNQAALCTATFDNVTISAETTPPPPPPPSGTWTAQDIGTVGLAGSHSVSGSTITINGSGADIWSTADGFRFVWQTRTGDGVVEARVASMGNTNGWAKAGVMIRESASPSAANVFIAVTPSWHGIVAQARSVAGGETTVSAGPGINAPYWVRLARTGNTFTASTSPDGMAWASFATFNVAMSATANFGFAVTSHDNAQLNQAVFQDPYVGAP